MPKTQRNNQVIIKHKFSFLFSISPFLPVEFYFGLSSTLKLKGGAIGFVFRFHGYFLTVIALQNFGVSVLVSTAVAVFPCSGYIVVYEARSVVSCSQDFPPPPQIRASLE